MIQMDLSSPDQHDTVCSGTAGTVWPVTRRDPAVLIKLFLTSAHMTAGHVSCDINTSCRMQHAHQQWRAGPTAWQEQWTNQQQEQQWSVWHVVISCSHTGSTQCVSTLTTAGCLRKHVVKKQVYLQPITVPVSQGVTEVLCSAPCGSSHFLSVTWYDDDMIYISTSPALSPAVQIKGQSASLRVRADLRFVFLFFHHHTFVFLKRNEHYSLTAALMQIQIINYISHLKSRFFMSYVSICWRYDALYIFSLGVVTTSLSHYLI